MTATLASTDTLASLDIPTPVPDGTMNQDVVVLFDLSRRLQHREGPLTETDGELLEDIAERVQQGYHDPAMRAAMRADRVQIPVPVRIVGPVGDRILYVLLRELEELPQVLQIRNQTYVRCEPAHHGITLYRPAGDTFIVVE